jgi:hypothetical protein
VPDQPSTADIATRYGLDGPGIESRWGARFSGPALGPTQPPGVKRPGCGVDQPLSSSADVKERVELYLSLWAFVGELYLNR